MRVAFAVGQDDGFIVVNKTDACADEVVFFRLPLDPCGNREAEIDFLEILLGDIQRFGTADGCFLETFVDGVDCVLEIFALAKANERNGGLYKN